MNNKTYVEKTVFMGLDCVRFGTGGYTAIAALYGGNVISLRYEPKKIDILRTPAKLENYLASTQTHGASPLFPPNRINAGQFTFEGRLYRFPINTPHNTHIHGFVKNETWSLKSMEADGDKAVVTFSYKVEQGDDIYLFFGHRFELILKNTLSKDGLHQQLTVKNPEEYSMPFGFAYHTTFNVPFNSSPSENFMVKANLLKAYDMEMTLPTGKLLELAPTEQAINSTGFGCLTEVLDRLYLADPSRPNVATIIDPATGDKVVYETSKEFRHWILYNKDAKSGYLCIEPQTWCNNAPNTNIEEANVMNIAPKGEITLTTTIRAE